MKSSPAIALLLLAAACSPAGSGDPVPAATIAAATPPVVRPSPVASPAATATAATPAADDVLTLDGLGPLRIGRAVPAGSGWAERGAQIEGTDCRTVSSPRYPGVYGLVEGGVVRRISVGGASRVRLVEGIAPGAPERAVRDAFPGFRETPHKYVDAPGKYLTTPGLSDGDVGLRFEIDGDRRVSIIHVGLVPALGLVEGCA